MKKITVEGSQSAMKVKVIELPNDMYTKLGKNLGLSAFTNTLSTALGIGEEKKEEATLQDVLDAINDGVIVRLDQSINPYQYSQSRLPDGFASKY